MAEGRQALRDWLWPGALAVYLALMFYISSRPQLRPPISFLWWDKGAHLAEYTLLGFLARRAVERLALPRWWPVVATAAFGALIGGLDEIFQRSVKGRHSSVADFAFDCLGIAVGLGIAHWMCRSRREGTDHG